jgi:hypothetical protein
MRPCPLRYNPNRRCGSTKVNRPQELKPESFFAVLTARLKPSPSEGATIPARLLQDGEKQIAAARRPQPRRALVPVAGDEMQLWRR